MGAGVDRDAEAFENERWSPAAGEGTVDLPTFFIARTETTVAQFAAFVHASHRPTDPRAIAAPPAHPATFVSWPEALAYCRWLEGTLARTPGVPGAVVDRLQSGWRIRLPTEAQWEKAARGHDGRRYPWGAEPRRDRANFDSAGVTPVGQFPCPECPHDLRDMSGNVWEWTSSPYQPYPYTETDDRANLQADALWVMRGGHYGDSARMVRTTARGARRARRAARVHRFSSRAGAARPLSVTNGASPANRPANRSALVDIRQVRCQSPVDDLQDALPRLAPGRRER